MIRKLLDKIFPIDSTAIIKVSPIDSAAIIKVSPLSSVDRTDRRPIAIYHEGDAAVYYAQPVEVQDAWNDYAQAEADAFDNNPSRDAYDTTAVFPGWNRDGQYTRWCPQLFFPEWYEKNYSSK